MRINGYLSCLALLLCACTTNTSTDNQKSAVVLPDSSSSNDAAICEVMYAAHPHNKAIEAVGEQRLQQTLAFDFADMTAFTRAFLPMTAAIAGDVVRASGDSLRLLGQELVLGGMKVKRYRQWFSALKYKVTQATPR